MEDTFQCPACGEDVPVGARACPHCGTCEKTGWDEDARHLDGLDLPGDDDFDYERFVRDELDPPLIRKTELSWLWWISGIIALIVFVILVFAHWR